MVKTDIKVQAVAVEHLLHIFLVDITIFQMAPGPAW